METEDMSETEQPGAYPKCTYVLANAGMAYPRTCQECGLGPCKRGHNRGTFRQRMEAAAAPSQPAPQAEPQAEPDDPQMPDALRDSLQRRCVEWGVYWRASDAHGVDLSLEQAVDLLQDALGVEVAIAAPSQPAPNHFPDAGKIVAQPLPGAAQPTYPACKGTNCGATDGWSHSPECVAEHDAACLGAQPAEAQAGERERFEVWLQRESGGAASPQHRAFAFLGWQARAAHPAQPVREAEPAPKREPLTDEQIKLSVERLGGDLWNVVGAYFLEGVRFAEKVHGIAATGEKGA